MYIYIYTNRSHIYHLSTLVIYFHESHAVREWSHRLAKHKDRDVVAACHDYEVALTAKSMGFKDIFYAKKSNTDGLTKTVLEAVEFMKTSNALKK